MPTTLQNTNILFNDSSTQGTAWTGYRAQIFNSSGTFTIPTGVTALKVSITGGGGGAAGAQGCGALPSAGGGGGTAFKWLTGLTPGNTITVTIGAGGTAGAPQGSGGAGGSSSISSGTQTITTVTGAGGSGGLYGAQGANGGSSTNADITYVGGKGFGQGGNSFRAPPGQPDTAALVNTGQGAGARTTTTSGILGGSGIVIFEW